MVMPSFKDVVIILVDQDKDSIVYKISGVKNWDFF